MKKCTKCGIEKDIDLFTKNKNQKDHHNPWCKECSRQQCRQWNAEHYNIDIEFTSKEKERSKQKYSNNPEHHKDICQKRATERRQIDPLYKEQQQIRNRINAAFYDGGYEKDSDTEELLGCSFEEFLEHLGTKPEGKVHKDHICPCAQAHNIDELKKLQHWSNWQWLTAEENNKKKDQLTVAGEELCRKLLNREWIYKNTRRT